MKKINTQNPGTTTLFITDIAKSNVVIPKQITWDQVNLPDNWILEKANPPVKQENTKLEEIVEYPDGDVEIRFSKNRITRLNLGRNSTSSVPLSSYEKENINVKNTSNGVSQPEYKVELPSSSRRKSPTPSDMGYEDSSVYGFNTCTLTKCLDFPFSGIYREIFYAPENEIKRKWFKIYAIT